MYRIRIASKQISPLFAPGIMNILVRNILSTILLILISFVSTSAQDGEDSTDHPLPPALIPWPVSMHLSRGNEVFVLSHQTRLLRSRRFENEQRLFMKMLSERYGINPGFGRQRGQRNVIQFKYFESKNGKKDFYILDIAPQKIIIKATSNAAAFYALQTLIQFMPVNGKDSLNIRRGGATDWSRFSWRGMHLDCSRHFFPVSFVKRYIDYIAMYKMNTFHWHLTDDQGWRIEIKKYPKLTEVGAWRSGSMVGHYRDHTFDTIRYGGYYTQDEIREVVQYAKERHVTIVPEIEMPGHAVAALASYPQYSCSGKPVEVSRQWGVETNVFCPTEETFAFLEDVLTEVMGLFPGKYIHIGGDEVPKDEWNRSEYCKALMAKEHLKDAHELQSYFIRRIEKFVNSKGRQIIGWDEILEGGLAPNAAVMSWRGTEGGRAAARLHHYVVMSPGSHCYFDHYQGDPQNEPLAIGGYTPVEKTYSYEPVPDSLYSLEYDYIMGAQGNVWTEYINTPQQVEYMAIPRMAALAEILWKEPGNQDWDSFRQRLLVHFKLLDAMGVNYAKSIFDLTATVDTSFDNHRVKLTLSSVSSNGKIMFTNDGSEPNVNSNLYSQPLVIYASGLVKAAYFENGVKISKTLTVSFTMHKGAGSMISLKYPPSENYRADGAFTLVNGILGNPGRYDKTWLGFSPNNLDATIDLYRQESFGSISFNYLNMTESWIHPPRSAEIYVSDDNENYTLLGRLSSAEIQKMNGHAVFNFPQQLKRFVRVVIENTGTIPPGFPGEGNNANMFIDEILVK